MYFEFYELKSWGKRSANNRRRFNQWLLKGRLALRAPFSTFNLHLSTCRALPATEVLMSKEIELKFSATEAQLAQLQARYGDFAVTQMETTYYDTPERSLSAQKITLRRRLENGISICTVKTPGFGLARGEWECEATNIEAALPILCKLGAPKELLSLPELIPVCGARFTRLSRLLTLPDAKVELALDRGVLLGGGRELPFCEVELELKEGSEESLLALANSIAGEFSLKPEPKSKFQRARELTSDNES